MNVETYDARPDFTFAWTVNVPTFVATPSILPVFALYLRPEGNPASATASPAFTAFRTGRSNSFTPADITYFSPRPFWSAAAPPAASATRRSSFAPVRLSTTIMNFFSTAFFTDALVSFAVTGYEPGFVAVPEMRFAFASNFSPGGNPESATFGRDRDWTSSDKSNAPDV